MNMSSRHLELELLRTFVAVVDGGGFTRAAERLHRTQSTVSQQLKRLEERLGAPVLARNTRRVALTDRGELLLGYARRLLALNDEALSTLAETRLQGRACLGAAQEVADGGLTDVLARFSRLYPAVALEVRVEANLNLSEDVARGNLDLAVLFQEPGNVHDGGTQCEVFKPLPLAWVASQDLRIPTDGPLPLVLHNGPCVFRNAALSALDAIGRPWRIVLSTPSLAGMRAALRAGLGLGVRPRRWLESDLRVLGDDMPPLPDVELALLTAPDTDGLILGRLRAALRDALLLPVRLR